MFCKECGTENDNNVRFCAGCGKQIIADDFTSAESNKNPDLEVGEEYILKYSFSDEEKKVDGKNVGVGFYSSELLVCSYKQNGGFNKKIRYDNILNINLNKIFSVKEIVIGIIILLLGLWIVSAIESNWEWYVKLFLWCIPICGVGKIIFDTNKIEIKITCTNGENVCFRTNDKAAAENFRVRLNKEL